MRLRESDITTSIARWLDECDGFDLAPLVGEIFDGNCSPAYDKNGLDAYYDFIPNENYAGEFDNIKPLEEFRNGTIVSQSNIGINPEN